MRKVLRWMGMVPLMIVLLAPEGSGAGQPNDAASVRARFIGTWRLVSARETLKDGTVRPYKNLGPKGQGYLMYSADGHMCAELMNPERPRWDTPPTAQQKAASLEGFVAYCGRFEVDAAKHLMTHYPEVAWKPNYVGTKQVRPYSFEGEHLVYSARTPPDGEPEVVEWRIEWEKVR